MPIEAQLRPGDVLLYHRKGIFGWIIHRKTWHEIAHVEVYIGEGQSVASRDRLGTGRYPLRLEQLEIVCRPKPEYPFDVKAALRWFAAQPDQGYGYLDLAAFVGLPWDGKGIVCSPFATLFLRAGGLEPFNYEPARLIAPFQFETSNVFDIYEVMPDGEVLRRDREISVAAS
jgi:hypothetical protein